VPPVGGFGRWFLVGWLGLWFRWLAWFMVWLVLVSGWSFEVISIAHWILAGRSFERRPR
jgi:hypothetical protein